MKYLLMMHAPRATGDWPISQWPVKDVEAHFAYWQRLNRDLAGTGELVGVEGLAAPGEARLVRAGKNGKPLVTDGPFAESKEFLAGYWIVEVDQPERAYAIAARASAAPGPGGGPLNLTIEVRRVIMSVAPREA